MVRTYVCNISVKQQISSCLVGISRIMSSSLVEWAAGLPPEVLKNMFSKTDVKTSLQCRLVCRHWDAAFLLYGAASNFALESAMVRLEQREDLPESHGLRVTAVTVSVKSAKGVIDSSLGCLILFDNEEQFDRAAEQLTKLCGSSLRLLEVEMVLEQPISSYQASDGVVKGKFVDRLILLNESRHGLRSSLSQRRLNGLYWCVRLICYIMHIGTAGKM